MWSPSRARYDAPTIFTTVNACADATSSADRPTAAAPAHGEVEGAAEQGQHAAGPAADQGVTRDQRVVGPGSMIRSQVAKQD
jgi:hypothetical protein